MTGRGKPAWSQTKLRHVGPMETCPETGDELRFTSGRRYQVLGIRGRALQCIILPPEAPVQGRVIFSVWMNGKRAR